MPRYGKEYSVGTTRPDGTHGVMWYGAHRLWWGSVRDREGNQLGDAVSGFNRADVVLEVQRLLADLAVADKIAARTATIDQIARDVFGRESLEVQMSDRLDFLEVGVATLAGALAQAFEAGLEHGRASA